jgi:cephalosporin hydroxylase
MYRYAAAVLLCVALTIAISCQRPPQPATTAPAGPPPVTWLELGRKDIQSHLLKGFHESEGAWRWTDQLFSVSVDVPVTEQEVYLEFNFGLAEVHMKQWGSATLRAWVNGTPVASETYTKNGQFRLLKRVPREALGKGKATLEFALDKVARPDGPQGPELALVAASVGLKTIDQTEEFSRGQARRAREGYQEVLRNRKLKLSTDKQNELMKLFHELDVWKHMWFQGVEIIKNPLDLWMMQQIIYEVRPDFIIETGTWKGGATLYWAHTLHGLGMERTRVLTVDVQDLTKEARAYPLWGKYVQFFLGSSADPQIVSRIAEIVKGKRVLVALDSDHTMNHVLNELRLYSPLVSPGSYLVVEDTHMDSVTYPGYAGPTAAVNRFLAEPAGKLFERDLAREAMVMTFNPGGWLRRKQ